MQTQEEKYPSPFPLQNRPLPDEKDVYRHISQYANTTWGRAWWEILSTVISYGFFMWLDSWWLYFPLMMLRVRMFVLFHDMGHNNLFPSNTANTIVGTLLGSTLLMSFHGWQKDHNYHHKHSNNLERKQYSQTAPWTVEQYNQSPRIVQYIYEILYNPIGIVSVVPFLFFYIVQRIVGFWYENVLSFCYVGFLYWWGGFDKIWLDWGPGFTGGIFGVFLFHLQHTFPGAKRKRSADWSYYENGMRYSSFLQLPQFIKYFTFGIEYHHVHHLNARVPGYKLQECHEAGGDLFTCVPKISLWDGVKSLYYNKYDEKLGKFVH